MSGRARAPASAQRGLTLVELMVAVSLGLLVSGAVISMYVSSSREHTQNERYAWMQENARYALKALIDDVSMVDFWGKVLSTDVITTSLVTAPTDCGAGISLFDADTAIFYNNYHSNPDVVHFAPCAAISINRHLDSGILALKRVDGSPTAGTFLDVADADADGDTTEILTVGNSDLQSGEVYLRSNGTTGELVNDASSANPPGVGENDWQYSPRVYFVRDYYETPGDGLPSLCRLHLNGISLSDVQCIAEGVEDLHVEFGIDADNDGVANQYTATPTPAQMEAAISARVFLLVRSAAPDPFYTNSTTYNLGAVVVPPANDGFYRRVYTTTVALRNSIARNLMN